MEPFAEHIKSAFEAWLATLTRSDVEDAYVVSVALHNEEDDPRKPYLFLGLNTDQQVARNEDRASDLSEARWNAAYWQDDPFTFLAEAEEDEIGSRLRREWIERLGLGFTDEEEEEADWSFIDDRAGAIDEEFRKLVVAVVQQLHADGTVARTFGRPVPLILHEDEIFDAIATLNEAANPPETVSEFASWVRNRGSSSG
jgi:hypothetical protein